LKKVFLFLLIIPLLSACFPSYFVRSQPEPARCIEFPDSSWCRGVASWYGKEFHGRKTSNGETYNMYGLSAAHRTLPLGTLIQVVSLDNEKSVIVKVNDRGPFVSGRILDLSYGAASALGIVQRGTGEVKFKVVHTPAIEDKSYFSIQAGAFSLKENALLFQKKLQNQFQQPVRVVPYESPGGLVYRVRVGQFRTLEEADRNAGFVAKENGISPFVLREDQGP
jgi:rare lipoprotein A